MKPIRWLFLSLLLLPSYGFAQFGPSWMQSAYWRDGKAEFDIYSAQEVRYGVPHAAEVIHILVQEPFSPTEQVKTEDPAKPGAFQVLKMNQIIRVPTGIYVYQQMQSNFWNVAAGLLIKFSFTSNDSCGNTYKEGSTVENQRWTYRYSTYWEGMSAGTEPLKPPQNGYFYDELPMRVRTIDFAGKAGSFDISLAPTMIHSKRGAMEFATARVQWKHEGDQIKVTVSHAAGTDDFELDAKSPFLLNRWRKWDGSVLELKEALKIPYWMFNQPGDRERAIEQGRAEMKKWIGK